MSRRAPLFFRSAAQWLFDDRQRTERALLGRIRELTEELKVAKKGGEPGALERLKGREPLDLDHLSALDRAFVEGELDKVETDCTALIKLCEELFTFIAERQARKPARPVIPAPQSETE